MVPVADILFVEINCQQRDGMGETLAHLAFWGVRSSDVHLHTGRVSKHLVMSPGALGRGQATGVREM
jgi:hypothetical protein